MNRLPIYETGNADPVGYVVIPDDPEELRRETLERLLDELRQEKHKIEGGAFKHATPMGLMPEVDFDMLDRLHRIYKVRTDRLERLIEEAR